MKSNPRELARNKSRLSEKFPGLYIYFDLEDRRRLQTLAARQGLTPSETEALYQLIADLVTTFDVEVPALIIELELLLKE